MEIKQDKTNQGTKKYDEFMEHHIKNRIELTTYLEQNMDLLEYDELVKCYKYLDREHGVNVIELMNGKDKNNSIKGQHNLRMTISIYPTWNIFRIITKIMENVGVTCLEDINAGTGLFTYIFKAFNRKIINDKIINDNNKNIKGLDRISGIDPNYYLNTSIKMNGTSIKKYDFIDYVLDDSKRPISNTDNDNAYILIDPLSYECEMLTNVFKVCEIMRPKLLIVIKSSNNINIGRLNKYKKYDFNPKIVSKYDTVGYNLGSSTRMTMNIYVRDDIKYEPKQDDFKRDLLQPVKNDIIDTMYVLCETKLFPEIALTLEENAIKHICNEMINLKLDRLPLYLQSEDEIENYLEFYRMCVEITNGEIPDLLSTRENFLKVEDLAKRKIWTELDKMEKEGVFPAKLKNNNGYYRPNDVYEFIILDNCYSDKVVSGVYKYYI